MNKELRIGNFAENPNIADTTISSRSTEINVGSQFLYSFDQIDDKTLSRTAGKGMNLVIMKRAGLPVPPGYCVTTEAHNYYLKNGKLPSSLIEEIIKAKKKLGSKIAIRSAADCEDSAELSMAGVFQSHYVYKDEEVGNAVEKIYQQSQSNEVKEYMKLHGKSYENIKMGLIIQELIEPEVAGVIYTGINGDNLLVQYVDGFGARLVDGKTQGSTILANKNGTILESNGFESRPLSSSTVLQMSKHSGAIEGLFSGVPQDIEFAYKDGTVHIVQARTLTSDLGKVELEETPEDCLEATKRKLKQLIAEEKRDLGTKTAIFGNANYSELLPKPTEMDIGVYMYVWGGSDGIPGAKQIGHSEMGYQVGDEATGIIRYIGGKTYFSIARNAGIYHIGFPETKKEYYLTLVNEYLDIVEKNPEKGSYPQMGLYLQDPTLKDLQDRYGDRALEYFQIYQKFVSKMQGFAKDFIGQFNTIESPKMADFIKDIQKADLNNMTNEQLVDHSILILENIRTHSYLNFVKAARLGFYYSQRLQSLLKDKLGMDSKKAEEMYSRLNQGLEGSAITNANISIAEADSEEEALNIAKQLIGHFSTGEMLEIRYPRLRDVPEAMQSYVQGIRKTGQYKEQFEKQKQLRLKAQESFMSRLQEHEKSEWEHIIQSSQTYMALRETAKYLFTKEYLLLRDSLELLGNRLELKNGDIYFVYPRELPNLVNDPESILHLIKSRKRSFKNYEKIDMPSIIKETDIDNLKLKIENNDNFTEATGKFLAEGSEVKGVIVNLDEFDSQDKASAIMTQYQNQNIPVILAATQMNLSHDPFIARASGLIIENAGIVAHGAQRARELGKGAIGGIKSGQLKTGIKVLFDPASRTVKRIE